MIEDKKIIERTRSSLNFTEQLQNQIEKCREGMSNDDLPLTPSVKTLEALLWAKLRNDKEYQERIKQIKKWFEEATKDLEEESRWNSVDYCGYKRMKATKMFKAIMVFIDKKGYMPIGEN